MLLHGDCSRVCLLSIEWTVQFRFEHADCHGRGHGSGHACYSWNACRAAGGLQWLDALSQHAWLLQCSPLTLLIPACAVIVSCLGLHWVNDLPVSNTAHIQFSTEGAHTAQQHSHKQHGACTQGFPMLVGGANNCHMTVRGEVEQSMHKGLPNNVLPRSSSAGGYRWPYTLCSR